MRVTAFLVLTSALNSLELPAQKQVFASPPTKTLSPQASGAPPVALAASGTPSTASLTWQWPAGATGFDVYRALAPSGDWVKLAPAPIAVTSFNDASGFRYGQAYVYRVVSHYSDGSYGNADLQFQPPKPQNPAWVKAVQQGSSVTVSWAPVPGASRYVVVGKLPSEGREVGAPVSSVTYQDVAAGTYAWNVGARFDPGSMETPATEWPAVTLVVAPASARYRVMFTGLSVLRETNDDPFQYDGRKDEVFVAAQALVLDRKSGAVVSKQVSKSMSYGDINNPPRIQAGSASQQGGLRAGDKVPAGDPAQPIGAPTTIALPLVAFDGTLTDGRDDVLIYPSIWEIDHGNGAVYSDWLTKVPYMRPSAEVAPDAIQGSSFAVHLANGEILYVAQEGFDGFQDEIRLDRPLGSVKIAAKADGITGDYNTYQFRPRVFRIQREEIERRLATPFIANNGASGIQLSIEFKEDHYNLWGDYVLHVWIERVP